MDQPSEAPRPPAPARRETSPTPREKHPTRGGKPKESLGSFLWFCIKLLVFVGLFRSFVFTSFNIPSESMMPDLLVGDYLFAAKWPYGYSRYSLPFDAPLIRGRVLADLPERGDVVIFKHPIDHTDYIKRVIGLPGDTVQLVGGVVHINQKPVGLERTSDFVLPIGADGHCTEARFAQRRADGSFACVYPRFIETLPGGKRHAVLDFEMRDSDNTPPVVVPPGRLFLMGDNRDNSEDSRFPAVAGAGVGLVPVENLVGRASFLFFSTDGSARLADPSSWFGSVRWGRIGRGI